MSSPLCLTYYIEREAQIQVRNVEKIGEMQGKGGKFSSLH